MRFPSSIVQKKNMSEPEKEEKPGETPGVSQDPLWFIYDETVTTEGMFRSTVPSSQSGAESMSFRCKQQTTKGQMPYLDIMSTRCGDYISSSSLKDQLEPHTRLFIEPISIPVMKHVGIRSELTDAKRSSHLVLEENEDDEEDENIISKTKSNASKIKNSPIGWIAVNSSKPLRDSGYSLLVQTTNEWAESNIETDQNTVQALLVEELGTLLQRNISDAVYKNLHRWRYANTVVDEDLENNGYFMDEKMQLAACGDWCIGSHVESAYLSGCALSLALKKI